jgi:hypothetical protein
MLTGKRAFEGASAPSVIAAVLEREPAPLEVSPPLARVVKSCLAKDPDERIQSARDVKTALRWAMEPPAEGAQGKGRHWLWIAGAALLTIGMLSGLAISLFRQPASADRAFRLDISPPEEGRFVDLGNALGGIALSPDGRMAAFVAAVNGKTGLWLRALDETNGRLLPATEGATDPFWSPDGKSIAFWAAGKLQRMDLAGGPPVTICEIYRTRGAAWSADGQIVFGSVAGGLFANSRLGGNTVAADAPGCVPRRGSPPETPDSSWRPLSLLGSGPQARKRGRVCGAAR